MREGRGLLIKMVLSFLILFALGALSFTGMVAGIWMLCLGHVEEGLFLVVSASLLFLGTYALNHDLGTNREDYERWRLEQESLKYLKGEGGE